MLRTSPPESDAAPRMPEQTRSNRLTHRPTQQAHARDGRPCQFSPPEAVVYLNEAVVYLNELGGFEQRDNLGADRPPSRSREGPPDGHVSVRGPRPSSIPSTLEPQDSRSLVIWAVPKLTAPFLRRRMTYWSTLPPAGPIRAGQ